MFINKIQNFNLIYFLALQKCHTNSDWLIHGLWIDYDNGGYPSFCKSVPFDVSILDPIRQELDLYWPSCYSNNAGFWKHEFLKHATCAEHNLTQYEYFSATLNLYKIKDTSLLCKDNDRNCLIHIPHQEIHEQIEFYL